MRKGPQLRALLFYKRPWQVLTQHVLAALDRGVSAPDALAAGYADLAAKLKGAATSAVQVELLFAPVKLRLQAGEIQTALARFPCSSFPS